jgi:single-strand DNA-binding protein
MIKFAHAQVQGNVGKVDVRNLDGNKKVASFSVASEESYKDGEGNWQNITTWVNVVSWNPGTIKYIENNVQVGRQVLVTGRLRNNSWEDDKGSKHTTLELHADQIQVGAKVADDQE